MRLLLLSLFLAACAEFPTLDARIPVAERTAPPPPLLPLTGLLATAEAVPSNPGFEQALAAEAATLQAQAAAIPAAGAGSEAERLAALLARAEALRDEVLTEEDRERLDSGPSLP